MIPPFTRLPHTFSEFYVQRYECVGRVCDGIAGSGAALRVNLTVAMIRYAATRSGPRVVHHGRSAAVGGVDWRTKSTAAAEAYEEDDATAPPTPSSFSGPRQQIAPRRTPYRPRVPPPSHHDQNNTNNRHSWRERFEYLQKHPPKSSKYGASRFSQQRARESSMDLTNFFENRRPPSLRQSFRRPDEGKESTVRQARTNGSRIIQNGNNQSRTWSAAPPRKAWRTSNTQRNNDVVLEEKERTNASTVQNGSNNRNWSVPPRNTWRTPMAAQGNNDVVLEEKKRMSGSTIQNGNFSNRNNRNWSAAPPRNTWRTPMAQGNDGVVLEEKERTNGSTIQNGNLNNNRNLSSPPRKPWGTPKAQLQNDNILEEKDMTDVSELKAAFLRTVQAHDENKTKQPFPATPPSSPAMQKSAWRRGGAKAFRQAQETRKREKAEGLARFRRTRQAAKTFFKTSQEKQQMQQQIQEEEEDLQVLLPRNPCNVAMLSNVLQVSKKTVTKVLEDMGEFHHHQDYEMDVDTMELVALELGLEPIRDSRKSALRVEDDVNLLLQRRAAAMAATEEVAATDTHESFPPRPPVVACMGHVDHGKTTLTDALRRRSQPPAANKKKKKKKGNKKSSSSPQLNGDIAGTEAGGITQVISAFQISLDQQQDTAVTFLDTPGHAAFRAMRESGSHAADVIVLVVAADDGVSPQTVEILDFYKSIVNEAGGGAISLVVAMTKIDKPGIDVEESKTRIANQLLEQGIVTEGIAPGESDEYGPPVQLIPVSGLTGDGLDDLIEGLVLQSEVMDLRADQEARAEGIVMDARVEKGLGVVADCIVRWGSLERGNAVVSGVHCGKVKVLKDVYGKTLSAAMPSQPVRIIGFESLPKAGDPVICVSSEEKAKRLVEKRQEILESDPNATFRMETDHVPEFQVTGTASKTSHMMEMAEEKYELEDNTDSNTIRIPVVIKADADGTLAAVRDSLLEVGSMSSQYDIVVDPVGLGIGPVLTSDVALARQSGAAIFCFGLQKLNDKSTVQMAENDGVVIRNHDVIYSLLDDAKDVFSQHLPLAPVEVVHGSATVQAIFNINNKRNAEVIAGLKVTDGALYKDKVVTDKKSQSSLECHYRVLRNGERISPEGESTRASSLKRVKEDVEDVRRGDECGLGLDGFGDFRKGDIIECYSVEMQRVFV